MRLTAPDGYTASRSYSVASPPDGSNELELTVERLEDGEVSTFLHDVVEVGDELEVRGPIGGWFVWDGDAPALLVGGGSGVVPLMAMLRLAARTGRADLVRLVVSVRTPDDLYYADELPGPETTIVYTREAPGPSARPPGPPHRATTFPARSAPTSPRTSAAPRASPTPRAPPRRPRRPDRPDPRRALRTDKLKIAAAGVELRARCLRHAPDSRLGEGVRMLLEGKVVVVSGVGPGLGREIAAAAAREGASVMMGARTEANLSAAADEIDPSGKTVGYEVTDITDADQAKRLADAAVEKFGKLDALVNCAALDTVFGGVQEADFDEWRKVFDTNVIGSLQVTRAAIPHLKANGGGSIVFIGSQGMFWPPKGFFQTAYQSSKAGLLSAVYHLANELGADKIRVNTVVPTWMWGPPVEGYVNSTAQAQGVEPEQVIAGITVNMPLGEIPTDGDVADAVVFFASDRARMVTAQTLMINAGEFPH